MPGRSLQVDVVVVGAGTAGANAAHQLARGGRTVVLLERRPRHEGGAQWHNGVLDRQFERAGLAPPVAPERVAERATAHVFGPDGTRAATVVDGPVVEGDMALLGRRVRALAQESGVEVMDQVADLEIEVAGQRVVAALARLAEGGSVRVEAALFVDASGRAGVVRRASPALWRWCPDVPGSELCAAGDVTYRVADRGGAARFLERHGAVASDHVNVVGRNGGWSTRSITVADGLEEVSVLVGCVAAGGFGTPAQMLAEVARDEPWIGERLHGANGLIPLRRPYARLSAPGVALVGDAGSQVFPAHGSGIGVGLIAGKLLAEAVAGAVDPGAPEVLWRYQAAFHRELGGLLAGYDALRRMSTGLGTAGVTAMVRAGILDDQMTRDGLDQRWGTPAPRDLPGKGLRLARAPKVAAAILPMLARAQVAHALGTRSPDDVDERALRRWDRRLDRVVGGGRAAG